MNYVHFVIIMFVVLLFSDDSNSIFIPDKNDYNAYGLKIAMNEILFVEVHNVHNPPKFSVRFAPYHLTTNLSHCSINISNLTNHYVYSIAVNEISNDLFFVGELINDQNGTFIGIIKDIKHDQSLLNNCDFTYSIECLYEFEHQDYYILGVEPKGHYAYGFSNEFIFVFDSMNTSNVECWNGSSIWPNNSFMPHAVHLSNNFGVISGFIKNDPGERVEYLPMIYLLNFDSSNHHPIIVDQYIPVPELNSWQDVLTNTDANIYSPKYDMSVGINERGCILVGMQYINRVFFLEVDDLSKPTKLINTSKFTNDRSIGYGKSVAWLDNGNMAAILVNTYTLDYDWETSQVHIYDLKSGIYNSSSKPLSVFPNYHQRLPKKFHPIFLNIISSSISLALLDNDGNTLIFLPTSPGSFLSIPTSGAIPLITSQEKCLPGTYKNQTGIHDCILCPKHTKSFGSLCTECIPCSSESFCPLGSSSEVSLSSLDEVVSSRPYPTSSNSKGYDGVLLDHIFGIRPNNCHFSPSLFITLVVGLSLFILIVPVMLILKYSANNSTSAKTRRHLKCILKSLDIIDEGNYWLGGLLSFSLITLIVCTCIFANKFIKAYPIENASSSYLTCDRPLVNAIFETTVKSLGIPRISQEQKMIDLLEEQNFTLNVQFINTLFTCDAAAIKGLLGATWSTLPWSSCNNINSTLSIFIPLPYQHITIKVLLADIHTIGGLRIGLLGSEYVNENYTIRNLDFYKSYVQNEYLLGRVIPVSLTLTKLINETVSMNGGPSEFSGVFIPSCKFDKKKVLLSADQYILSTSPTVSLELSITESSYYEKNLQQPMAEESEVIFYTILWIFVCFDLFCLIFLLYKLLLKPIFKYFTKKISSHRETENDDEQEKRSPTDVYVVTKL